MLFGCALFALLFAGSMSALSWTYKFRSYEPTACFYIDVKDPTDTISIYYNLHESKATDTGHDIDYYVNAPNGQQLMAEQKVAYKDFKVQPTMAGEYAVCFKHHGSATDKVVDLDVGLVKSETSTSKSTQSNLPEPPTANLERTNRRVKDDLTALHHSLLSMKDREKGNFNTVKSILSVVKMFSVFQCLVTVFLGFAQVYLLKTFFSGNTKTRA